MKNKYTLYIDMDGVLCDFLGAASALTGYDLKNHKDWIKIRGTAWKKIAEQGSDFWANLPWTEDGKQLWAFVQDYNPQILSAYPTALDNKSNAIKGKHQWIGNNLTNVSRVNIVKGMDKQLFANKYSILVDDSKRNIKQFQAKGGVGIHHKTTLYTITTLKLQLPWGDGTWKI